MHLFTEAGRARQGDGPVRLRLCRRRLDRRAPRRRPHRRLRLALGLPRQPADRRRRGRPQPRPPAGSRGRADPASPRRRRRGHGDRRAHARRLRHRRRQRRRLDVTADARPARRRGAAVRGLPRHRGARRAAADAAAAVPLDDAQRRQRDRRPLVGPPCSPGPSSPRSTCSAFSARRRCRSASPFCRRTSSSAVCSLGLSARVVTRFGLRRPLVFGLVCAAIGLALFARAPVAGSIAVDVLPGMLLLGLGAGIAFNPLLLAAMSDVDESESGLASGIVNTSFMMGGALGLAVLASLAALYTGTASASGASESPRSTTAIALLSASARCARWSPPDSARCCCRCSQRDPRRRPTAGLNAPIRWRDRRAGWCRWRPRCRRYRRHARERRRRRRTRRGCDSRRPAGATTRSRPGSWRERARASRRRSATRRARLGPPTKAASQAWSPSS